MAQFSVLFDACVLVPIVLTDTILRLAEAGLYRPLWSDRILEETALALVEIHQDMGEAKARSRMALMNEAFVDASVTGWEDLESSLSLPDPGDRHVLAAAIRGRADLIVTANLSDFPLDELKRFDLEAQSPDEFLLNQLDLSPNTVLRVLGEQADATRNPALTIAALLDGLARAGAPKFAQDAAPQSWRARAPQSLDNRLELHQPHPGAEPG